MYKLCVTLPPFSPDYSGVCSALFELGGLLVIHDASGCTGNYTGYDEPRWYGSSSMVYCSSLREIDAVMGDDEKLVKKIAIAAKELLPKFIVILGSPVPMVIGSDLFGIAAEVEACTGIPSFGFATTGLEYYDKGISDAFLTIAKKFVKKSEKKEKAINLLGMTPLDFSLNGDVEEFRRLFENAGYRVVSDFVMHSSLDDITKSACVSANVVVSASGLTLAKWFEKNHGIPYIVGTPVNGYAQEILHMLDTCIETGESQFFEYANNEKKNVFIMHDQIIGNALRQSLSAVRGVTGIDVGTAFGFDSKMAAVGDRCLSSERLIAEAVNSGYQVIVADPLVKSLIKEPEKIQFIPLPHVAISSKLYWDTTPSLCSDYLIEEIKAALAV